MRAERFQGERTVGLRGPKVVISTEITVADSKYSSQVFLKIKREADPSPLEGFGCAEVTFSLSKTKHCDGKFHASLAQLECQTSLCTACLVYQRANAASSSSAPPSSLVPRPRSQRMRPQEGNGAGGCKILVKGSALLHLL